MSHTWTFERRALIRSISQSRGDGYSPKTDFRSALIDWVENGNAPDVIVGTHYEAAAAGSTAKPKATFQRPLCKVSTEA